MLRLTDLVPTERGERGQASVEAAVLMPTVMILIALLVQPICALYTLTVMRHAAAETARVLATGGDEDSARNFALRRLTGVPEVSLFHVGGAADWYIKARATESGDTVSVSISGHIRPLPFFGVGVLALGRRDVRGIILETSLVERVRPSWLMGTYEDWMDQWDTSDAGPEEEGGEG